VTTLQQMSEEQLARQPAQGGALTKKRALRWLVPSLADVLFIALFAWLLAGAGATGLLSDGDVGWHIRTGDYILEHRSVPRTDLFTFTKPGAPWFAWEWLSDVMLALLHGWMGLKGVVLIAAVVLAAWPVVVLRHALWRGANVWMAVTFGLLAVGSSSIHYLARPHVFTLLFTAVAAWLIDADRRRASSRILWLVPLSLLWTNLHGGFGLVVALAVLTSIGSALEAWAGQVPWKQSLRYAGLAAVCGTISIANPYGLQLHAHIFSYLQSDWIRRVVDEFKAPDFRSESLLQYELVLFVALIATGLLLSRKRFVPALWIVAFAHLSLSSVRHVPVFMIVATPIVAEVASTIWSGFAARAGSRSVFAILDRIGADARAGFGRLTVWPLLAVMGCAGAGDIVRWPRDFPAERFPVKMVRSHAEMLAGGRVLTIDQWGDYLIYAHYPRQRVFADGRSDFLGPELGNEYLRAMQGHYGWQTTLDRHAVDTALLPATGPLSTVLKLTPGWRVVADDSRTILFTRIAPLPHVP
jgi:hypothetical protein